MVDLTEFRMDANLAADHLLSVKRSMDLKRQQITWELGLQLCQNKAKEAAANKKAKILHSCGVIDAKVDCTKAVLEAKYSYRVVIQEAKMIWGNQLQELEVAYSKALGENAAVRSSWSKTLHREHVRLMQELEEQAIREDSKSHHNFLSNCQAVLCHALQFLKEKPDYLLPHLARKITFVIFICSTCQNIPSGGTDIHGCLSQASTQMVPMAKKVASFARAMGKHVYRQNFPSGHAGRTNQL